MNFIPEREHWPHFFTPFCIYKFWFVSVPTEQLRVEDYEDKESIPLILGVLTCFLDRVWSCLSSFWRASLAFSGSTSNCSESLSTAWTTQEEDGVFLALLFLQWWWINWEISVECLVVLKRERELFWIWSKLKRRETIFIFMLGKWKGVI